MSLGQAPPLRSVMHRLHRVTLSDLSVRAMLAAGGLTVTALVIREIIQHFHPAASPFLTLYPAVAVTGIVCGPLTGGVSAVLGALAADYLWIPPRFGFWPDHAASLLDILVFLLGSAIVLGSASLLRTVAAEARLAKSTLDLTLAAGQVGTLQLDPLTGAVTASASACQLHGLAEGDQPRPLAVWLSRVEPADAERLRAAIEGAVATGTPFRCDYRVVRPEGGVRWISLRGGAVMVGANRRLLCGLVDITDRIETQDALHASDARFRAVLKQIPAAAAIIAAPNAEVVLRSDRSDDILGHAQHQVKSVTDLAQYGGLHPDGRPYAGIDYPITRALVKGETVEAEKLVYRRPDGTCIDMEVYAAPIRDSAGAIMAAAGMAFDVSARKRAEDALRASEARFRTLAEQLSVALEAASLGVWETDLSSGATRIDARLARMLGLAECALEVSPRQILAVIHPSDRLQAKRDLRAAFSADGAYVSEFRAVPRLKAVQWFVSQGAVRAETGRFVGVVRDVTSRRRREDALREALETHDLLIREADHRIKNSLQLVVSLLTAQQRTLSDPKAVLALQTAVARVNAVAASHLALQTSPDLKTVDFGAMLADLCRHFAGLRPDIAVRAAPRGDLRLDADRAIPLGLAVSELLTNALRHAYARQDRGLVEVSAHIEGADFIVAVRDDGQGMPPAPAGSGLGSRVVRSLVAQIAANAEVFSTPNQGTQVIIKMPVASTSPADLVPAKTP